MNIELHASGIKLPPDQARELTQRLQATLRELAVRLVRVFVKPADTAARRSAARECVVEVHMADGSVARVSERQRHLGALIRRVVSRAWTAARPAGAGGESPRTPARGSRRPAARRHG